MLWHYIKYTLRLFLRDRLHSLVTLLGLIIGLSCGIIILLFITNELSYEGYHEHANRIYRVSQNFVTSGNPKKFAVTSPSLGPKLLQEYPQIETFTRLKNIDRHLFQVEDKIIYENHIAMADTNYFKVFSHRFIYGDPASCLQKSENIVLTKDLWHKYFGDEDPVGKTMLMDNEYPLTISAVIENPPPNTHFYNQAYLSYLLWEQQSSMPSLEWPLFEISDHTFLLFHDDFDSEGFYEKWPSFYQKYIEEDGREYGQVYEPIFERLTDIHYHSGLPADYPQGNKAYFYTILSIGIFLIIMASINYTNMATARSIKRLKDISIHKVLGAGVGNLVIKILSESVTMTFLSLLLAFGMVEYLLEFTGFTDLLGLRIEQHLMNNEPVIIGGIVLAAMMGILSGLYPALSLSFHPSIQGLRGFQNYPYVSARNIRQGLVIFQLIMAVVAITTTILMKSQISYLANKDLGFNKENVILIPFYDSISKANIPVLQAELQALPQVMSVCNAYSYPGLPSGGLYWFEGNNGMEEHNLSVFFTDYDYLNTLGITLIKGRDFSKNFSSEREHSIIINETLAAYMDWEEPLGKRIQQFHNLDARVIGVVKDFNFLSLHHPIEPLMIRLQDRPGSYLIVRTMGQETNKILTCLEDRMKELVPFRPFEYDFLDARFRRLYQRDEKQLGLISLFSGLCIFIAGLGLFTLVSYMAESKTKEVGIRKVNGASTQRVISLFIKHFLLLSMIAILLSTPIIIWIFKVWLREFAYQTEMSLKLLIFAYMSVILITIMTVCYHSVRASQSNPVNSLRYE